MPLAGRYSIEVPLKKLLEQRHRAGHDRLKCGKKVGVDFFDFSLWPLARPLSL